MFWSALAQRIQAFSTSPSANLLGHIRKKASGILAEPALVDGDDMEKVGWINSLHCIGDFLPQQITGLYSAARAQRQRW